MNERDKHIVLDHDNFFTDSEQEITRYQEIFLPLFAKTFNIPFREASELFSVAQTEVRANPHCHLFTINNLIVGPGTSDHVLATRSAAILTLIQWHEKNGGRYTASVDGPLLTQLYKQTYPIAGTVYRQGAKEILIDLHKTGRLTIATGSGTPDVQAKLHTLLGNTIDVFDLDIKGDAGKSHIDVSKELHRPISIHPSDQFPYPVYLRRPKYAEILRNVSHPLGVVGADTYTTDLSLPEFDGMYTVLLSTPFTAPWEHAYYENHPNGIRVQSLEAAREALDRFV